MEKTLTMTRLGMTRLLRRYSFFAVVVTYIFLGVVCVPSASAGYEIFDMGGVRGLYNSAWLGVLGTMLCSILLWLPGFYLLRSQITEDTQLKMQHIIAATPVSKIKYLSLKAGTNFLVLVILQALFLLSFVIMQLIRGEDLNLSVTQYLVPFIFVSLPALCVAASMSVFFDVLPFLKGVFGNILIFIIWILGSSVSVAMPQNPYDLFGIGFLLDQLLQSVKQIYPSISTSGGSFGYYPIDRISPTFLFDGVVYSSSFLVARLMWIGISVLIIIIAATLFGRFKKQKSVRDFATKRNAKQSLQTSGSFSQSKTVHLPAIKRTSKPAFLRMMGLEIIILLPNSIWWYIVAIGGAVACFLLPINLFLRWSCLVLLLPIGVWSKMGCHEKLNGTKSLIISSCSPILKWWLTFMVGIVIAFMLSIPILARFIILSLYSQAIFWMIGIVFVSSLAMTLGRASGNTRFFEAVYIVLFYIGEINGLRAFDFLGITGSNIFYLLASLILICINLIFEFGKRGSLR